MTIFLLFFCLLTCFINNIAICNFFHKPLFSRKRMCEFVIIASSYPTGTNMIINNKHHEFIQKNKVRREQAKGTTDQVNYHIPHRL